MLSYKFDQLDKKFDTLTGELKNAYATKIELADVRDEVHSIKAQLSWVIKLVIGRHGRDRGRACEGWGAASVINKMKWSDREHGREIDADAEFVAKAVSILSGPHRPTTIIMRAANPVYYGLVLALLGWIVAMALDTQPPVKVLYRTILTPEVRAGDKLQVRTRRIRQRQCELSRRFVIVDGIGRRFDFEPEKFDAYGPIGPPWMTT